MNALPELSSACLWLICAPGRDAGGTAPGAIRLLLELTARLALLAEVRVLDGGNCFNVYTVAQNLRRRTPHVEAALRRIRVARAFTCYQVVALLQTTPASPTPTLALDLLATFQDESVPLDERRRLLQMSIAELRRLSRQGQVLVSAHPRPCASIAELHQMLEDAAERVWRLEPAPPVAPVHLF